MQVYGVIQFTWHFAIPLIIFVYSYWNILAVVRRQAKSAADRHQIVVKPREPAVGTSTEMTETRTTGLTD